MAYSISQDRIIQEVSIACMAHASINTKMDNWDNIMITLCNHYDRYDKINPSIDMENWSAIDRAAFDSLNNNLDYDIQDNTHVYLDDSIALVHMLRETVYRLSHIK